MTRVDAITPLFVNDTANGLTVGSAIATNRQQVQGSSSGWTGRTKVTIDRGEEIAIPTVLEVDKIVSNASALKRIVTGPERTLPLTVEGVYEETIRKLEKWNYEKVESSRWSKPLMIAVAIGMAYIAGPWGASAAKGLGLGTTMGTMVSAGVTGLASTAGTTFVANNGDLEATLKNMTSRNSVMSLAAQVAKAGLIGAPPPGLNASFGQITSYAAMSTLVGGGVNVALGRERASEAFHNAGINFIGEVAGRVGANQISRMYSGTLPDGRLDPNGRRLNFWTHKGAHGIVGLGLGALKGDAAAGALGGMVAELVADLTVDDAKDIRARVDEKAGRQGISKGSQDYQNLIRNEVQTTMNWSKLGAAVAVALAGHDVDVGVDVATNALENNFVPLVAVGVAAVEALASAGGATLAASAGVLTALGLNELATSFQENDDSSTVVMDAHPEDARWEDEGVTTEEARARPLITPTPERMPTLGGYEGASSDVRTRDEGYTAHHGPDTSVLMNTQVTGKNNVTVGKTENWIREPSNIQDQMALNAAKQGEGKKIIDSLNDPLYKGMEKWEFKVKSASGKDSVVHYVKNPQTGELLDFKFKKRSID
ncbi:DUF637 domain-containing protein [Candidatus Paracaedibacter symbiosus]|uniref:DUF637 domain-containing protein n=1 Tax=Candidatus Paracaedibacter symbiosus TaxID=244582 RepID=UPI0012EBE082|nr:DUF637 domain-containing protein [Candidatus Paracaedibacter symbiosus]